MNREYDLKELFFDIVNNPNYATVEKDLLIQIDLYKESNIEEFIEYSRTMENSLEYMVNSFIDKSFNNGYT